MPRSLRMISRLRTNFDSPGVFTQVIELKARVQIKFPITPTYRGQCPLAAVIEERLIIFIALESRASTHRADPIDAEAGTDALSDFPTAGCGTTLVSPFQEWADVAPINHPTFRNLDAREGGQSGIPVHRPHDC